MIPSGRALIKSRWSFPVGPAECQSGSVDPGRDVQLQLCTLTQQQMQNKYTKQMGKSQIPTAPQNSFFSPPGPHFRGMVCPAHHSPCHHWVTGSGTES